MRTNAVSLLTGCNSPKIYTYLEEYLNKRSKDIINEKKNIRLQFNMTYNVFALRLIKNIIDSKDPFKA